MTINHHHHTYIHQYHHQHDNQFIFALNPYLAGARTLDIAQAQLENFSKLNAIFGFSLGSTLNEILSPLTLSISYIPAQANTLILSPDGG